jgi:hypothetical protein
VTPMIRCSKCLKTWTLQQLGVSTATSGVHTFWCPDCDPEEFKQARASKESSMLTAKKQRIATRLISSTATRPD